MSVESWLQLNKEYLGIVVVRSKMGGPVAIVRAWIDGRPVENRDDFSRKRIGNVMAFGKDNTVYGKSSARKTPDPALESCGQ